MNCTDSSGRSTKPTNDSNTRSSRFLFPSSAIAYVVVVALCFSSVSMAAVIPASVAQKAEPNVTYGSGPLPLPKTILFSASPDSIAADAAEWARRGVTAFFVDFVAREWSTDIWAADGEPWTIGPADKSFQKTVAATEACRRVGSDTFLKVSFDHYFDWFNDTMWQKIENNFRNVAIFARDTGCTGVAVDIEYVGDQYDFDWEGYTYSGYTRADLVKLVRKRVTGVIKVMYDEFPKMVFLTFPEQNMNLGMSIHTAWIEEAARRNAPGGVHLCTEFTYRLPNVRYMMGHVSTCNETLLRVLSTRGRAYWRKNGSIAPGVWPFGFNYETNHNPGMDLPELKQGYASSLMLGSRYNWIYSHNSAEQLIGRGLEGYEPGFPIESYLRVFSDREVVTTEKYANVAAELRRMHRRDFSADLGLIPAPLVMGPKDTISMTLMPAANCDTASLDRYWGLAKACYRGEEVDFHKEYGTVTSWMMLGPFSSPESLGGHDIDFGPEKCIDLSATYDGLSGPVRWTEYTAGHRRASVDLTAVFDPDELVCAYALCYVKTPRPVDVQMRVGTNDSGKLWVGGKLVMDTPSEGAAILDREIVPVHLDAGATPVLLKVCNNRSKWCFIFRITDDEGNAVPGVECVLRP